MSRIPYPNLAAVPADIRDIVSANPYNLTRMIAGASPAVVRGYLNFSFAFYEQSKLPGDLREVAILRIGYVTGAKYETFQHEAVARREGLGDAQIQAIKAGGMQPTVLTAAQQAVLDFAEDMTLNVRAGDATLSAVRQHLPDQLVLDLILVSGLYIGVCRFLETTGIEIDAPIAWSKEPA